MTIRFTLVGLLLGLSFSGCSKKSVAESAGLPDKVLAKAPNPQISADLVEVSKSMEARQYDVAVSSLIGLKQVPKTEAEQRAYIKQLQQANDMLVERAAKGDDQAAQSYRVLGHFMTGR